MDFSKFDKAIDLAGLQADIEDAKKNGGTGDYKEVPCGKYECKLEKLELTESKSSGKPMVSAWFTIVAGEFKNSKIFMNQVVTQGFQLHIVNTMLKTLVEEDIEIKFESYTQYAELLLDVAEYCDDNKLEFVLDYSENKGFKNFKITEVFEG